MMLTMFREHLADELQRFPDQPGRLFESYAVTTAALTRRILEYLGIDDLTVPAMHDRAYKLKTVLGRIIHFRVSWPESVMPGDTKPRWIMVYSDRTRRYGERMHIEWTPYRALLSRLADDDVFVARYLLRRTVTVLTRAMKGRGLRDEAFGHEQGEYKRQLHRLVLDSWDMLARLLGADHVGRDIFSRLVHGARISVAVAGIVLFFGVLLGVTLGIIAGYYGGLVDEVIMFIVVVWLGVPFLLIALIVVALLGPSVGVVMVLLISNAWIGFVRNTRAEVFSLKERDYVALARVAGASTLRIIYRHILPGVANTVVVLATLAVGGYILTEATLSFLGAGIPPPTPAWGLMVAEGNDYLIDAWWISVFPGMAIFLVVMSFNFVGDWLRDRWDPRLRQL